MAAVRPEPTAPNRYIFNWAHSLVGYSAHILASTSHMFFFFSTCRLIWIKTLNYNHLTLVTNSYVHLLGRRDAGSSIAL